MLTLFINQREYIGVLSQSAGMRLLVHRADQHPFVEDYGIDVGPGTLTALKINMVSIHNNTTVQVFNTTRYNVMR